MVAVRIACAPVVARGCSANAAIIWDTWYSPRWQIPLLDKVGRSAYKGMSPTAPSGRCVAPRQEAEGGLPVRARPCDLLLEPALRLTLEQINEGFAGMAKGDVIRAVLGLK